MPNIDAKMRQRLGDVLRTGYLRNILIVSVCIAVVFPIADRFFIYPLFSAFVIENSEEEAVRAARHLALELSVGPQGVTKESLPPRFIQKADEITRTLGLMKFKVFSKSGETLFSTVPEEIGRINEKPYFRDIVAKGGVYTKFVKKDTKTSEGEIATLDVVETYYPISSDGVFAGAFEIYYDITGRIAKIDRLLFVSSIILVGVASGLLIVMAWTLNRAVSAAWQRDLSEARFKDFAEVASDWFWEMDEELRFSYLSGRYYELSGRKPEDLIGKTRRDLANETLDSEKWQKHFADLDAHKSFRNFTYRHTTATGETMYISTSGDPVFDDDGVFKGYRGTGSDDTDRVQAEEALRDSEQRFRDIAEVASDWFWEMGPDLRFTYFSERYTEVTGYPIGDRIGTSRLDHSPENYTEEDLEQWNAHIADLKARLPFKNFEYATTATPRASATSGSAAGRYSARMANSRATGEPAPTSPSASGPRRNCAMPKTT